MDRDFNLLKMQSQLMLRINAPEVVDCAYPTNKVPKFWGNKLFQFHELFDTIIHVEK